jgi:xylulokinase
MYAIGYDIGSSSIKAALVDLNTRQPVKISQYPKVEMEIASPESGWAEQDPEIWWDNLVEATKELLKDQPSDIKNAVRGIGISYQMHGLVLLDEQLEVLRPSIIWCDSRAVATGDKALQELSPETCFAHLLNEPGNFTGSKFGWVYENEPDIYDRVRYLMLPGDYVAFRLTGQVYTTASGLSEGMLWDFVNDKSATFAFDAFGIRSEMIPPLKSSFSEQGGLQKDVADALGIPVGIPVCYRAGDQPNNAMSLGVLEPGEIAATGGTSGVVYAIADDLIKDPKSRINSFAHINHHADNPRIGVMLCINGAGSLYRWVHQTTATGLSYNQMEKDASGIPVGADGLVMIPFGNGSERMLNNVQTGGQLVHIDLNRHSQAHVYRAALEGIAFAFVYGMEMMGELGVDIQKMKAGNDNLFQSEIFSVTISTLLGCEIELVKTTGAVGAAKAVAFTLGYVGDLKTAMSGTEIAGVIRPNQSIKENLLEAYHRWKIQLEKQLI